MKKTLLVAIVTLLAVAIPSIAQMGKDAKAQKSGGTDLTQQIIENERKTWEGYKNRDAAAIKAYTASDYVSYTQTGPSDLEQDIANLDKITIESYSIDEPKVMMPAKNVAILRYKCDLKGSFEGKSFSPVYATSVWINRGGKWQIVSYSETIVG